MKNIKIFCSWDLQFNLHYKKQIELYVDSIPKNKCPDDVIRFVLLVEPPEILDLSNLALKNLQQNNYHYLLTHNQDLLDSSNRAHLFEFGTSWINNYSYPNKKYAVSTLIGGKCITQGHKLRTDLLNNIDKIVKPKNIFISGNTPVKEININEFTFLRETKEPLFDSQFHICIENVKRRNFFTEKLMDCLVTKTVPIYWGCPNIGDWFDLRGFIIVDSVSDIINSANSIDSDLYEKMLPYIELNNKKSLPLRTIADRVKNKILNLLN